MIRLNGFADKCLQWQAPENIDASNAEEVWQEWVRQESARR